MNVKYCAVKSSCVCITIPCMVQLKDQYKAKGEGQSLQVRPNKRGLGSKHFLFYSQMDLLTKKAVFSLKREVTPWFFAKVKAEALGLGQGAGVVAECQEPLCLMLSLLGESSLGLPSQNVENFRLSQAECLSLMLSDIHKIK